MNKSGKLVSTDLADEKISICTRILFMFIGFRTLTKQKIGNIEGRVEMMKDKKRVSQSS